MNGTNIFVYFLFYNLSIYTFILCTFNFFQHFFKKYKYTASRITLFFFCVLCILNICIAYKFVFNITFALYFRMHASKAIHKARHKTHKRHSRTSHSSNSSNIYTEQQQQHQQTKRALQTEK